MSVNTAHDYQEKVTHRIRITVPVIYEVEVIASSKYGSDAKVQALAITTITEKLTVMPIEDRYSWQEAHIDAASLGSITFTPLTLKPVPAAVVAEEVVAEEI